ncbi:MAG: DoxX family membrane protein [Acidobacteria bacterium]|nr:DoxX family membrane protein [Acidobacteriota bacterium]
MNSLKIILKYLLVFFFVAAGVNHFVNPDFYIRIMPPYLPWHRELVYLSGVFEIVFGLLVLVPRYLRMAGWGLIVVLIAVYPANIHMALNSHLYPDVPVAFHYIRLPLQFVFIAWVWWVCMSKK